MAEWKFRRRQGWCSPCEREFADGERHLSALVISDGDLVREDRCLDCWEKRDPEGSEELIWWATRFEATKKRTFTLDLESLERVFLQLNQREEQQIRELRYVLCLLLMRKRRLKLERVQRGEDFERLIVRRPKREELFEVEVFDFSPDRIDELRGRLAEVFEGFDADEESAEQEETEGAQAPEDSDELEEAASSGE